MILRLAVFTQYQSVTDTHTQTDGRTDTRLRHVLRLVNVNVNVNEQFLSTRESSNIVT